MSELSVAPVASGGGQTGDRRLRRPTTTSPLFALVHATGPHPPLQLNAACEFIVVSDRVGMVPASADATEDERAEARSRYVKTVIISAHGPDSQAQFAKPAAVWSDGLNRRTERWLTSSRSLYRLCWNGIPSDERLPAVGSERTDRR